MNEKAFLGSYKVLHKIDRCKKLHTIGKELILPDAIEIAEKILGKKFAKQFRSIHLSNDTVARQIDDIAKDVQQHLFEKLRGKLFSIQLDEATDSNRDAHLIAYVRLFERSSAVQELLLQINRTQSNSTYKHL